MPDLCEIDAGTIIVAAEPVVNVLERPEEGIPLVTQLLLGWTAQVMGIEGDWFHIQAEDGSPGWAKVNEFCLPLNNSNDFKASIIKPATNLYPRPNFEENRITLFLGSQLEMVEEAGQYLLVKLPRGERGYIDQGDVLRGASQTVSYLNVIRIGDLFYQTPYLWGGMTARGIDCSGLTYISYYANGFRLPRDAQDQYKVGAPVGKKDLRPGDLVFFSTIDPSPSHVGIYQGNGFFLNARTKEGVTATPMDDPFFSNRYLGARRYIL